MRYAYQDAVLSRPYGYLIVDLRLETPPAISLLTNVLHEDGGPVYAYK